MSSPCEASGAVNSHALSAETQAIQRRSLQQIDSKLHWDTSNSLNTAVKRQGRALLAPTKKRPTKKRPTKKRPTHKRPTKKRPTKKRPTKKRPTKKRPTKSRTAAVTAVCC